MNFSDYRPEDYPILSKGIKGQYFLVYLHDESLIDVSPDDYDNEILPTLGFWDMDTPHLIPIMPVDQLDLLLKDQFPEHYI